ncbi:MAG: Dabb family protein, partial [Verrucomicrobiota bacterium]
IGEGHWGRPADTHRDVVDRSYGYSITLFFDALEDHDSYQKDPDHDKFIERCSQFWERVQVYDVETGL